MATAQLSELRDALELELSIPAGSAYVDSVPELRDLRRAYEKTAEAYNWREFLTRVGIVKIANLDRYSLPANFRKARTIKLDNVTLGETEQDFIKKTRSSYLIDKVQNDIIVNPIPTTASSAFVLDDAETAGNAVVIDLDTVSGLSQFDEIWVDSVSGTDEFTIVSSVDSANTRITARLDANKSASDTLYRQDDILDIKYYRRVNTLSSASDTLLLPDSVDFIIIHYAAFLAYYRLEQYTEGDKQKESWRSQLAEAWLAEGRGSTGYSNQFTL